MHAFAVSFSEDGVFLQLENGQGKLGHRVSVGWHGIHHLEEVIGQFTSLAPFLGYFDAFFIGWNIAGQKKIEHSFWQGLFRTRSFGQLFPNFWNGVATEANSFIWVQGRAFPHHAFDAAHATIGLGNGDI
jgi:hypothetical protein